VRTGRKGERVSMEKEKNGEAERESKDRKVNKERRKFLECIRE